MNHTPGEWSQATRGPDQCPIVGNGKTMICKLAHSAMHDEQAAQAEANAKLIAAAPKMLKALEYARDNHHEGEGEYDETLKDAINEAIG